MSETGLFNKDKDGKMSEKKEEPKKEEPKKEEPKKEEPKKEEPKKEEVSNVSEPKNVKIEYKYNEPEILNELKLYLDRTYGEHYTSKIANIQCFDGWIARGNSTDTFVNTAMKYLWRYGKKNGNNKDDLMKALHYTFMAIHVDHFLNKK